MRSRRKADLGAGLFFAGMGILTVAMSLRIAGMGMAGEGLHPRTLPCLLGVLLLVAGVSLAAVAWLGKDEDTLAWPDESGRKRLLVVLVALGVYLRFMELLGFALSTLGFVTVLVWYLGHYRIYWAGAIGLAGAAMVYLVFIYLLGLPFPTGILSF